MKWVKRERFLSPLSFHILTITHIQQTYMKGNCFVLFAVEITILRYAHTTCRTLR